MLLWQAGQGDFALVRDAMKCKPCGTGMLGQLNPTPKVLLVLKPALVFSRTALRYLGSRRIAGVDCGNSKPSSPHEPDQSKQEEACRLSRLLGCR